MQISPNKTSGLIRFQAVQNSDGSPEIFFKFAAVNHTGVIHEAMNDCNNLNVH